MDGTALQILAGDGQLRRMRSIERHGAYQQRFCFRRPGLVASRVSGVERLGNPFTQCFGPLRHLPCYASGQQGLAWRGKQKLFGAVAGHGSAQRVGAVPMSRSIVVLRHVESLLETTSTLSQTRTTLI